MEKNSVIINIINLINSKFNTLEKTLIEEQFNDLPKLKSVQDKIKNGIIWYYKRENFNKLDAENVVSILAIIDTNINSFIDSYEEDELDFDIEDLIVDNTTELKIELLTYFKNES